MAHYSCAVHQKWRLKFDSQLVWQISVLPFHICVILGVLCNFLKWSLIWCFCICQGPSAAAEGTTSQDQEKVKVVTFLLLLPVDVMKGCHGQCHACQAVFWINVIVFHHVIFKYGESPSSYPHNDHYRNGIRMWDVQTLLNKFSPK